MSFVKKHKYILVLLGLISLAVFVVFLPSLINKSYFVGGGDVKTQWFPFYILNKRATISSLKQLTLPFYSFILFLGNNIWASKTSYGLFDIYNVLSYLFNNNYFAIYDIQSLIKILISGITFYLFIDYVYKNKKVSLLCGLAYALGSYGLYFTSQPGFLSFYSLVPLYFLGIEKYFKDNKKYLFIILVFLLLVTNYYYFYAASLFLPIYFIYRYYNLNRSFKGLIKKALILILYYLLGVLLSGIIILPTFLYILQNERVGYFYKFLEYKDISVYFHLLVATIVPNHTYIYAQNVFDIADHTLKEICLYAGTITILLIPQIISDKDKKFKYSTFILYICLILFLFLPVFSSILNGFSEPCFRWTYLGVIINIFIAAKYLSDLETLNKKNLIIAAIIESLLIIITFIITIKIKNFALTDYYKQGIVFLITILFIFINVFVLSKNKKLILLSCIVELLTFGFVFGLNAKEISINKESFKELTNVLADDYDYHNLNNYLNSLEQGNEEEYYRVYVPLDSLYWGFSPNLGIVYNINGLMTYDSTYTQSFNKMRVLNYDEIVDVLDWQFNIKDKNIIDFLSTKYAITANKEEIPFNEYEIIADDYRGSLIISKNKNYRPFGTTYTKYMPYKELKDKKDTALLNEYLTSDTDLSQYLGNEIASVYNVTYGNNKVSCQIDLNSDSFLVLGLPYEKGWKVFVNGENINYYECNGGMIGFGVNGGHNDIEMVFVPEGFMIGAIGSGVGVVILIYLIIKDVRRRKRV